MCIYKFINFRYVANKESNYHPSIISLIDYNYPLAGADLLRPKTNIRVDNGPCNNER